MAFDIGKIAGFNPKFGTYQKSAGALGTQTFKGKQGLAKQEPSNGFNWRSLDKFDQQAPVISGQTSNLGNKLDYFV